MSRRTTNSKRMRLEQLERRELLAADLGFVRHNAGEPLDVNNDAFVTPLDALDIVNELNLRSEGRRGVSEGRERFMDVNNDQALTPIDALTVINGLNERARGGGGGRGDGPRNENPPPPNENPPPDQGQPREFASIDGSGNNIENPELGSVGVAFDRWVGNEYEDGLSEAAHSDWASAREVSNIVNAAPGEVENRDGLSDLTWLFGQFIDHDITLTGEGTEHEVLDITVPTGDPFFDPFGTGEATIGFSRSGYLEDSDAVRQQFNEISAFIDGSVIYGSDQERADALRSFEGGRLLVSEGDLLPFNEAGLTNAGGDSENLFLAGDIRANENAALISMHTIWVREHNRVADRIAAENPELSDEEIYQRARQFVTGELQAITYNEFLPAILGRNALPDYDGYDSNVNPNISNVFATAAYRFGHTMLSPELLRLNADGTEAEEGHLALQDAFFNVSAVTENGVDSILRGASAQVAQEVDPYLVDDVRNFLFGPPGSGGFDLAALNIQRGRDHGLADYNQVRTEMGLDPVTSFDQISSDPEVQSRLEEAYGSVDNIDAWVGMLAEDHVRGGTLGETASTIIAEQFLALRDGDRFYYENVFEGRQLRDIENTTLADVIERNSDVDFARDQNVFFAMPIGANDGRGGGGDGGPRGGNQGRVANNDGGMATPPIDMQGQAIAEMMEEEDRRMPI